MLAASPRTAVLTSGHVLLVLHASLVGRLRTWCVLHPYFAVVAPVHGIALPFLQTHAKVSLPMVVVGCSIIEVTAIMGSTSVMLTAFDDHAHCICSTDARWKLITAQAILLKRQPERACGMYIELQAFSDACVALINETIWLSFCLKVEVRSCFTGFCTSQRGRSLLVSLINHERSASREMPLLA